MKKTIITICAIFSCSYNYACDICGGGLGSNYLGLLPDFNNKFVGIRYHHNQLRTQLDINGNITSLSNLEKYNTMDMWGAWNIAEKWRVMAILPYSKISKFNYGSEINVNKSGVGDINLMGFYNLLNKNSVINDNRLTQSLWLGLGVKFGSGKYQAQENQNNDSPNIFQLGTGSTDYQIQANYDIRLQNTGISWSGNYKINTENSDNYKYGNKLMTAINLYHKFSAGLNNRITPTIGMVYEHQQRDHHLKYELDQTGGKGINAVVGVEANFKKLAIGLSMQKPIHQDLNMGRTIMKHKISSHITYTL